MVLDLHPQKFSILVVASILPTAFHTWFVEVTKRLKKIKFIHDPSNEIEEETTPHKHQVQPIFLSHR